jgi:hypothetical protein
MPTNQVFSGCKSPPNNSEPERGRKPADKEDGANAPCLEHWPSAILGLAEIAAALRSSYPRLRGV